MHLKQTIIHKQQYYFNISLVTELTMFLDNYYRNYETKRIMSLCSNQINKSELFASDYGTFYSVIFVITMNSVISISSA